MTSQQHLPAETWTAVLASLARQTTASIFDTLLGPLKVKIVLGNILYLSAPEPHIKALQAQWEARILAALPQRYGIEGIVFDNAQEVVPESRERLDAPGDATFVGAYLDPRNTVIQPNQVEVHSQYFRRQWRPLLGPTLSELVRELRQRCHHKSGRNAFEVTYKTLGAAIGVSERTIKRAFARRDDGEFENALLGYFIAEMDVMKQSNGKGGIRNLGTRFVIYLDEPLTPEDEDDLRRGQNGPAEAYRGGQNGPYIQGTKWPLN